MADETTTGSARDATDEARLPARALAPDARAVMSVLVTALLLPACTLGVGWVATRRGAPLVLWLPGDAEEIAVVAALVSAVLAVASLFSLTVLWQLRPSLRSRRAGLVVQATAVGLLPTAALVAVFASPVAALIALVVVAVFVGEGTLAVVRRLARASRRRARSASGRESGPTQGPDPRGPQRSWRQPAVALLLMLVTIVVPLGLLAFWLADAPPDDNGAAAAVVVFLAAGVCVLGGLLSLTGLLAAGSRRSGHR